MPIRALQLIPKGSESASVMFYYCDIAECTNVKLSIIYIVCGIDSMCV